MKIRETGIDKHRDTTNVACPSENGRAWIYLYITISHIRSRIIVVDFIVVTCGVIPQNTVCNYGVRLIIPYSTAIPILSYISIKGAVGYCRGAILAGDPTTALVEEIRIA